MKKIIKSKGFLIFLILLVAANVAIFVITRGLPKESTTAHLQEDVLIAEKSSDEKIKADEGKRLSPDSLIMVNVNNHAPFSFSADSYLVVRFSEVNCETCIENIFSVLDKYKQIDSTRIILLADFMSEAFLRTFIRLNSITYPIFKYPAINSPLEADKLGYPYVFVMDKQGLSHDFFQPMKEDQQRTNRYLDKIRNNFSDR